MKTVIKISVNRTRLLRGQPAIAIQKGPGGKKRYTCARELLPGSVIKQVGKSVWVEEYEPESHSTGTGKASDSLIRAFLRRR